MISIVLMMLLAVFDAHVMFEHNPNSVATREFKFRNIASPSKNDAAATTKMTLIDGNLDGSSGSLATLIDGRVPQDEDEPGGNVFFRAGSTGGRFRMDFTAPVDIDRINSYSWHPNSRGPQLYKVYGADGSESNLNLDPKRGVDPASCGWKLIALVSTLPEKGDDGGQYAASITDVGKHRYLLFDVYVTELYDNWGNTFYSEIDVIRK
jgi:hypothetical protein